jgi:acetyl esterase/lipase
MRSEFLLTPLSRFTVLRNPQGSPRSLAAIALWIRIFTGRQSSEQRTLMHTFLKLMACSLVVVCISASSQVGPWKQSVWQPSPGHVQVPLWPAAIPDSRPTEKPEHTAPTTQEKDFVAGKPWLSIEDVSRPTLTVYQPKGKNTGVSVMVFPGGGFSILAIDLEGTEVCDWLMSRGITCILLKYRVPNPRSAPYWGAYPGSPMSLEDAQRAMGLVRLHAKEWRINPGKLGVLGFSAGGHLVAATSVHFGKRVYKRIDAADDESCRPDFAVAIYPGHLSFKRGTLELNPDIAQNITARTPPTFLLQNENDDVDSVWDALSYHAALIKANVPVEFHSYAEGGHAFGLRSTKHPATRWPQLVELWLHTIGMISE